MLARFNKKYEISKKVTRPLIFKVNPNYISLTGLFLSVICGYLIYKEFYILSSLFLLLHGYCDLLDGAIAKKFRQTPKGDFLDHTFDRISDTFIFLGIALNQHVDLGLGLITIIAILLVSYLGTQAQAVTKKRLYSGFGRADRFLLLFIFLIISNFYFILDIGTFIILIISIISFIYRFFTILKKL